MDSFEYIYITSFTYKWHDWAYQSCLLWLYSITKYVKLMLFYFVIRLLFEHLMCKQNYTRMQNTENWERPAIQAVKTKKKNETGKWTTLPHEHKRSEYLSIYKSMASLWFCHDENWKCVYRNGCYCVILFFVYQHFKTFFIYWSAIFYSINVNFSKFLVLS